VQESSDGLLIYDKSNDAVHSLEGDSATVWQLCDGGFAVAEVAASADLTEQQTREIVSRLDALGLLAGEGAPGISRRDAMKRLVGGVAAVAAVPTILSIVAPTAAMANSATCPGVVCVATAANNSQAAHDAAVAAANAQCATNGQCQTGSTCNGTFGSGPTNNVYSGLCVW